MDLLKWIGIDVQFLIEKRRQQLEKQAKIDEKLSKLPCYREVAEYFLQQREQNRKMCREYDTSYREYYKLTLNQLDFVDNELNRVEKIIDKGEFCKGR